MQQGKKILTFSYDDGVTQDRRLIDLLNRYGLRATFHLNSGLLGTDGEVPVGSVLVRHQKVRAEEVRTLYSGHEVAAHTLTHPLLTSLPDEEVVRQVEEDRLRLSDLCGTEVVGLAYPGGGANHDDRVVELIRSRTGIRYARTIRTNGDVLPQKDLYRFLPTVYHRDFDALLSAWERFVSLPAEETQIFFVWGHSYELDVEDGWTRLEEFFRLAAGEKTVRSLPVREAFGV